MGRTHILRTHPRYPRHFQSTEKKKNRHVVASTFSILTSAVSFSLFLSVYRRLCDPGNVHCETSYFRHDISFFHFFRFYDLLKNIPPLIKLFLYIRISKSLSPIKTVLMAWKNCILNYVNIISFFCNAFYFFNISELINNIVFFLYETFMYKTYYDNSNNFYNARLRANSAYIPLVGY